MDSMHRISNSLPPARKRLDQPELLADFKAAALSVTNLYKSAAASQDKARAAGYQDAVEDLLGFLDRENLGLMDGEGWSVRQWATERLVDDGVQRHQQGPGSEDEAEDIGQKDERRVERSSSPETQKKPQQQQPPSMPISSSELQETSASPRRSATSEPPPIYPTQPQAPANNDFSFRSTHPYPTNHDRDLTTNTMDLDNTSLASSTPTTPNTESPAAVRIIPRSGRGRHTNHNRRNANSAALNNGPTINFNLGTGAGSKRKTPYPDFFDISGFNFDGEGRKDGAGGGGNGKGGGKRGRYV